MRACPFRRETSAGRGRRDRNPVCTQGGAPGGPVSTTPLTGMGLQTTMIGQLGEQWRLVDGAIHRWTKFLEDPSGRACWELKKRTAGGASIDSTESGGVEARFAEDRVVVARLFALAENVSRSDESAASR